jgi:hypothetical protein
MTKIVEILSDQGSIMKVYKALFNPMTEESGYITLSLHRTKEGAEKAVKTSKEKELKQWKEMYNPDSEYDEPFKFGTFLDWNVSEVEILD